MQVEAPDFIRIDRSRIEYHPSYGCFPTVRAHVLTDRPGVHRGEITIHLIGHDYETRTKLIPVSVTVIARPTRWAVLVTETPFQRYSTEKGVAYEPLTTVTTRLAERGVRIDFRSGLPKSLDSWNAVLLGEDSLAFLNAGGMERLHRFVAKGGRLIVAADAFFGDTAPKANRLLSRYGLSIDTKDAGRLMLTSRIATDPLTRNVSKLSFFRPARVTAIDSKQVRFLAAMADDETCGFIAASKAEGRGDVVLLAQSLWWNWLGFEGNEPANAVMLERCGRRWRSGLAR
jgi:hypothetical protein